ncbi:MAG: DUF3307 domain-containing protein [Bacteroidia bacterium]
MDSRIITALQLIISHLLIDFVFQPKKWVDDKNQKTWKSVFLYIHTFLAAFTAWLLTGRYSDFTVPILIFISHTLIDWWKTTQKSTFTFFVIDQFLHLVILFLCWIYLSFGWEGFSVSNISNDFIKISANKSILALAAGYIMVIWVARILIQEATKNWYAKIQSSLSDDSLENAGMWIGIFERTISFTLIILNQYEAIGLLIAAKSILRFREINGSNNNLTRSQTEYVLIGTLLSFGIAILTGITVKLLM